MTTEEDPAVGDDAVPPVIDSSSDEESSSDKESSSDEASSSDEDTEEMKKKDPNYLISSQKSILSQQDPVFFMNVAANELLEYRTIFKNHGLV